MSRHLESKGLDRDWLMRRALALSVVYNLGGAFLFAFPSSVPGQLAGLPAAVPGPYRAMLGMFVLLFGGAYAWLAAQPEIDRPLVAFAAIGKTGAFAVVLMFWFAGDIPGRGVLAAIGDLLLAVIFAWWLFDQQSESAAASASVAR
jgi:hypothetical protein